MVASCSGSPIIPRANLSTNSLLLIPSSLALLSKAVRAVPVSISVVLLLGSSQRSPIPAVLLCPRFGMLMQFSS